MSDNKNYEKKLILNYTSLTRLARKEPLENFPIIVNKYYPELIPQYLVLYSEKEFYDMDNSAVCFYLYDEKFNGQHGLWNSIYYDNQEDLTAFYERFKNVKIFIEPDISQVDSIEIIENKYRVFMNRVMVLWFIHQIHAWIIPNITFADRYSFEYMLLGIEECEVVAFSLKGSMEHSENMEIYLEAIVYTVEHMKKLKAIIVFSTSKYDEKVLGIFKKAIDKGILIYIPNNTQKVLNCRKKQSN